MTSGSISDKRGKREVKFEIKSESKIQQGYRIIFYTIPDYISDSDYISVSNYISDSDFISDPGFLSDSDLFSDSHNILEYSDIYLISIITNIFGMNLI